MDKKMITYLENIVSLEKSIYTQTQTINQIENRISGLGIPTDFPVLNKPALWETNYTAGTGTALYGGAIFGGIIGFFFGSFLNGCLIGATICLLIVLAFHAMEESSENKARERQYEIDKEAYDRALMLDCARVDKENAEKDKLVVTLHMMKNKLRDTEILLDKYYALNIIFPKYRNLIAMCSMYEYFISGRCTDLIGHEGAYNIYESEVRLDRIYTKLDEVVHKLEEIKTNQYVLYDAIQEGNATTQRLVNASVHQAKLTQRLIENSEVAAYYQQQTANEANQIKWLMLYDSYNRY